jgi:hypothetical protein
MGADGKVLLDFGTAAGNRHGIRRRRQPGRPGVSVESRSRHGCSSRIRPITPSTSTWIEELDIKAATSSTARCGLRQGDRQSPLVRPFSVGWVWNT